MRKVNPWVTPFYLAMVGVITFNLIAVIEGLIGSNFYPGIRDF
jgi:hypothetical protein